MKPWFSWGTLVDLWKSRRERSQARRGRMGRNRERFFRSEPLEPRILLAANLDFLASASTPQQLTLLADSTRVQIVASNDPSQVLASELLANITGGVRVAGNGFDL